MQLWRPLETSYPNRMIHNQKIIPLINIFPGLCGELLGQCILSLWQDSSGVLDGRIYHSLHDKEVEKRLRNLNEQQQEKETRKSLDI